LKFEILNNPVDKPKLDSKFPNGKKVYIETYGCQMNLSDTEIIISVLGETGYVETDKISDSDLILLNTCSVRENAEQRIFNRLEHLKSIKKRNPDTVVGILGCMAERLRNKLVEDYKFVDLIVGPDEYRKLPSLIDNIIETGEKGIAVKLSKVETYDDLIPARKDGITGWISVMRGCDNFCTFCVVPFTRGRERSRSLGSIVKEAENLYKNGIKEVTLLGQNVNSYLDVDNNDFPGLLKAVASAVPEMRIRYTTSHPYDLSHKLLETMAEYDNICKYIHLPVQSGSDRILQLMNRLYTVEKYMEIMKMAKELMPGIGLSTDIISGFPTENEDDHKMTLEVMEKVEYDGAYMFAYSPRENTKAYKMDDDVPEEVKQRRLSEIIELQRNISLKQNKKLIGKTKEILLESLSKKSDDFMMGRTDCNKSVIIPRNGYNIGDKVLTKIERVNSATLFGLIEKNYGG